MSRRSAIDEQHRLFPGQTLPEIVLNLRASLSGSSDPIPAERVQDVVLMLRQRLAFWEDTYQSNAPWERLIDDGVRKMVFGVCNLGDVWLAEKQNQVV